MVIVLGCPVDSVSVYQGGILRIHPPADTPLSDAQPRPLMLSDMEPRSDVA